MALGMADDISTYVHGIRANIGQFAQQLLQVFFVGLAIGMQRTVVPAPAELEFGVPSGSFTLLMAFVVSFGFVKGAMNFFSGRLSERVGRRMVLIWGWPRVSTSSRATVAWLWPGSLPVTWPATSTLAGPSSHSACRSSCSRSAAPCFSPGRQSTGPGLNPRRTGQVLTKARGRDFQPTFRNTRLPWKFSSSSRSGIAPSWPCRRPGAWRSSWTHSSGDSFRCTCAQKACP